MLRVHALPPEHTPIDRGAAHLRKKNHEIPCFLYDPHSPSHILHENTSCARNKYNKRKGNLHNPYQNHFTSLDTDRFCCIKHNALFQKSPNGSGLPLAYSYTRPEPQSKHARIECQCHTSFACINFHMSHTLCFFFPHMVVWGSCF